MIIGEGLIKQSVFICNCGGIKQQSLPEIQATREKKHLIQNSLKCLVLVVLLAEQLR